MAAPSKIVHITCGVSSGTHSTTLLTLFALCSNGTVWSLEMSSAGAVWTEINTAHLNTTPAPDGPELMPLAK